MIAPIKEAEKSGLAFKMHGTAMQEVQRRSVPMFRAASVVAPFAVLQLGADLELFVEQAQGAMEAVATLLPSVEGEAMPVEQGMERMGMPVGWVRRVGPARFGRLVMT